MLGTGRNPVPCEERCEELAKLKLARAATLPLGAERSLLETEARQLLMTKDLQFWLTSPGLQPPTKK